MRIFKLFIIVLLCISLSSCVWFFANNKGAIGLGKKVIEYDEKGEIAKETIETKSILENIFSLGGMFGK